MARVVLQGARRRRARRNRGFGGAALLALLTVALIALILYYVGFFPKQAEKITYPLTYEAEIRESAERFALDPARVAAVIYCESSFRADAQSSVGALGLMQIMPDTGAWIAKKMGDEAFTTEKLQDPATNILYGCWYLDYLNGRFDGDFTKVTAAYHAGGGKVDEWLKSEAYSADGTTLSVLPDNATGRYVEKVRAVYEKYKEIMKT